MNDLEAKLALFGTLVETLNRARNRIQHDLYQEPGEMTWRCATGCFRCSLEKLVTVSRRLNRPAPGNLETSELSQFLPSDDLYSPGNAHD